MISSISDFSSFFKLARSLRLRASAACRDDHHRRRGRGSVPPGGPPRSLRRSCAQFGWLRGRHHGHCRACVQRPRRTPPHARRAICRSDLSGRRSSPTALRSAAALRAARFGDSTHVAMAPQRGWRSLISGELNLRPRWPERRCASAASASQHAYSLDGAPIGFPPLHNHHVHVRKGERGVDRAVNNHWFESHGDYPTAVAASTAGYTVALPAGYCVVVGGDADDIDVEVEMADDFCLVPARAAARVVPAGRRRLAVIIVPLGVEGVVALPVVARAHRRLYRNARYAVPLQRRQAELVEIVGESERDGAPAGASYTPTAAASPTCCCCAARPPTSASAAIDIAAPLLHAEQTARGRVARNLSRVLRAPRRHRQRRLPLRRGGADGGARRRRVDRAAAARLRACSWSCRVRRRAHVPERRGAATSRAAGRRSARRRSTPPGGRTRARATRASRPVFITATAMDKRRRGSSRPAAATTGGTPLVERRRASFAGRPGRRLLVVRGRRQHALRA